MYFFYLIEQHSKFLLHTLQVLYMCTLCDFTNINTIIDFVPNCFVLCHSVSVTASCAGLRPAHETVTHVTKTWSVVLLNKKIHVLLSQVYCV
jgi:hypothetical protein